MPVPDDFDPTHALDGWRAPAPAPLDLSLQSLQPARSMPAADPKKQAWLKQHGFEMTDVEDVEVREPAPAPHPRSVVPEVALPPVAPMPRFAVPPPLDRPPSAPALDPRLLAQWQPAAWQGLTRRLSGAAAEVCPTGDRLQVEHRAAQWLCAAWPPQPLASPRDRWPAFAALVEADSEVLAWTSLLGELPAEAPLWLCPDAADWGLVAELLLAQDPSLRPPQQAQLQALADDERRVHRTRLSQGYVHRGRVARARS